MSSRACSEFEAGSAGRASTSTRGRSANNGWQDRWRADPTGALEAQFHQLLAQHSQRAHFGDVRDMSQDTEEGITLDQYAQITVAVSRAGANVDDIVRQSASRTPLTGSAPTRRGARRWARPHPQADDAVRPALSKSTPAPRSRTRCSISPQPFSRSPTGPQDVVDEPQEELTPDLCLRKMGRRSSPSAGSARHYAHMADLGNVPDKGQSRACARSSSR